MVSHWTSVRPAIVRPSVFSFPGGKLTKCQWILTTLGLRIDIIEICLGLLIGKCRQFLTELPAR